MRLRRPSDRAAGIALLCLLAYPILFHLYLLVHVAMKTGSGEFPLLVIFVILPVPIWVALVLWLDRIEPEPVWLLAGAFLYGGVGATWLTVALEAMLHIAPGPESVTLAVPFIEELAKGLFLFLLIAVRRD